MSNLISLGSLAVSLILVYVLLSGNVNSSLNSRLTSIKTNITEFRTESGKDRRNLQTSMNVFQAEMREIAKNQGRLEGLVGAILVEQFNNVDSWDSSRQ